MAIATKTLAEYIDPCACGNYIEAGEDVETQGDTMIQVICSQCGQGFGAVFSADRWEEMFED